MEFRLLGPLEVVGATGRTLALPRRERVVLALLLLEAGRVVSVERLIDGVWDQAPPDTARKQIQICISAIRRQLADDGFGEAVSTRAPGYVFDMADPPIDLAAFDAWALRGRAAVAEGRHVEAAAAFRAALGLWRGEPLVDTSSQIVAMAATGLTERRLRVAEEYADVRLTLGEHHEVIGDMRALVACHPLREALHVRLMSALAQAGRSGEALDAYRTARRIFVGELGVEPGEELSRLAVQILGGRHPASPTATARRPESLTATGRHPESPTVTGRRPESPTASGRHPESPTASSRRPAGPTVSGPGLDGVLADRLTSAAALASASSSHTVA